MLSRAEALVVAVRSHGEHGALVRLLTREAGLVGAYVAGARGRQLRPVLIPGNRVAAEFSENGPSRAPSARVELINSRGPWLTEPLASAAIAWVTALTAATLPERHPYPALHDALGATLDAICHAPSARGWARALAGYEALVMRELGYGGRPPPPELDWDGLLARLDRQGLALSTHVLAERGGDAMGARAILIDRLQRI